MRIVAFAVAGGLLLSAQAYQDAKRANCDLRAAYDRSIDWLDTFTKTSTNDPSFGAMQTGTYTLASDLVSGRLVIDRASNTVLGLGEGRTMTLIGQTGTSPAIGSTGAGSGGTVQLKSGTILLPATYPGVTTYPYLGLPRASQASGAFSVSVPVRPSGRTRRPWAPGPIPAYSP